jgi:glycine/D-amino acid oxidase-like deaminating enzyme
VAVEPLEGITILMTRSPHDPITPSPRVAVIGAGLVGAAVAFRLAEQGGETLLLDRAEPGSGATAVSFAGVNAAGADTRAAVELVLAAIEEHRRLAWRLAPAPWFHADGSLQTSDDPERQAAMVERVRQLQDWGYAAELLPARTVQAELEPGLASADPESPVAWFPDEGWVDAPEMTRQLVRAGRNAGGRVLAEPSREVVAIERTGDRITSVTLADGQTIPVATVVNAAGVDAARVAALAGREMPMTAPVGMAVRAVTRDGATPLLHPVVTDRVAMRPDGPGRVWLVPRRDLPVAGPVALDGPEVARVMADAAAVVPALAEARPVAAMAGAYAVPDSGYLSAGAVPGLPGYYEIAAYSGVTLAPLLGRSLANEILGIAPDPLLDPFRPSAAEAA